MEIDLQAINRAAVTNTKGYIDTSSKKIETTIAQSKTEETVKKQQQIKKMVLKNLENELQENERQQREAETHEYLKKISRITDNLNRKLKYSVDRDLDQIVVKVVDAETDKIIKEIPPEELKRLYIKMKEAIGSIVDTLI